MGLPPTCIETNTTVAWGDLVPEHITTSYVERQNLTMRTGTRRSTHTNSDNFL
jgi:hypothetical protein